MRINFLERGDLRMEILTELSGFGDKSVVEKITFIRNDNKKLEMKFLLRDAEEARWEGGVIQAFLDMNQADPGKRILQFQVQCNKYEIVFTGNLQDAIDLLIKLKSQSLMPAVKVLMERIADKDEIEIHGAIKESQSTFGSKPHKSSKTIQTTSTTYNDTEKTPLLGDHRPTILAK